MSSKHWIQWWVISQCSRMLHQHISGTSCWRKSWLQTPKTMEEPEYKPYEKINGTKIHRLRAMNTLSITCTSKPSSGNLPKLGKNLAPNAKKTHRPTVTTHWNQVTNRGASTVVPFVLPLSKALLMNTNDIDTALENGEQLSHDNSWVLINLTNMLWRLQIFSGISLKEILLQPLFPSFS